MVNICGLSSISATNFPVFNIEGKNCLYRNCVRRMYSGGKFKYKGAIWGTMEMTILRVFYGQTASVCLSYNGQVGLFWERNLPMVIILSDII